MAKFEIHARAPNGSATVLHYDNQASTLTWANGTDVMTTQPVQRGQAAAVCIDQPGLKAGIKTLKVSLGLSCNYECSYCSQRFVPHAEATNAQDIEPFIAQLTHSFKEPPQIIEFWGGEPLVYWKTLKPLAERLRQHYPNARFSIITNGSLLDTEKNEWLDRMGFDVGLSHDGPGYHARGVDPLQDPQKRQAIMDLYALLQPKGRISINTMMHSANLSRAHVQAWLQEQFGKDVQIGEGAFIDPYDAGGLAATMQTPGEHIAYRTTAFKELRLGLASQFHIAASKVSDFANSIATARQASSLGQKCGMDRPENLAVDLLGNVITCQNVSAAATAPNGQPHAIGHLNDLPGVKLRTSTHWSNRKDCADCPVLQLCKGGCMFLEGDLWDADCDAAYSDNVPFFAAAIEFLTGCVPIYIDGDFRDDRKDIFGLVNGVPDAKPKRVIPINAIA